MKFTLIVYSVVFFIQAPAMAGNLMGCSPEGSCGSYGSVKFPLEFMVFFRGLNENPNLPTLTSDRLNQRVVDIQTTRTDNPQTSIRIDESSLEYARGGNYDYRYFVRLESGQQCELLKTETRIGQSDNYMFSARGRTARVGPLPKAAMSTHTIKPTKTQGLWVRYNHLRCAKSHQHAAIDVFFNTHLHSTVWETDEAGYPIMDRDGLRTTRQRVEALVVQGLQSPPITTEVLADGGQIVGN